MGIRAAKGRIQVDAVIDCGICDVAVGWSETGQREAAKLAREDGWIYTKRHGWICSDCAKREGG